MAQPSLNAIRLRELLNYDSESGHFTWKIRTSNRVKVGDIAGALNPTTGYISISIDGKLHRANRLARLYVTGEWPAADVDHKNGVRTDNRYENLRDATRVINQQNLRAARGDTASGELGVYASDRPGKPWRSSIKVDGKDKHLGRFASKEEAKTAYLSAKRRMHEGCTI